GDKRVTNRPHDAGDQDRCGIAARRPSQGRVTEREQTIPRTRQAGRGRQGKRTPPRSSNVVPFAHATSQTLPSRSRQPQPPPQNPSPGSSSSSTPGVSRSVSWTAFTSSYDPRLMQIVVPLNCSVGGPNSGS